jgi:hypothetical protein
MVACSTTAGYAPYYSTNYGTTWTTTTFNGTSGSFIAISGNGQYSLTGYATTALLISNYLAGYTTTTYTTPTFTPSIAANINCASISGTGQYMVLMTVGSTNNVYYSINYGANWTALTVGSSAMTSCAISYDGSYITVSNATTVYTLNLNSTGYSIAVGSSAGTFNQGLNAIAIGNQAGAINQAANSIVLNATGNALNTYNNGFFVGPVSAISNTAVSNVTLLGYGTDSQITQVTGVYGTANGYVGIGTANPYTGLHIYHSSNPKVYLQGGSYTGFLSMFTSGFLDVGFDTGAISGSTTGGVIRFYPNGSEAIRIANNGYMGIGTNNPGAVLQVNNTAASYTTPTLSVSDGAADLGGTYGMLNLTRQSATADNKAHISLIRNGSSVFNIGYLSGSNIVGFLASSANMSSGSGFYVASNGNVGIGSSGPSGTLHVVASTSNANRTNCLIIKNSYNGQSGLTLDGTSASGGHQYNIWATAVGEANPVGGLTIYDDTAGAYRMVISSGGNVGIGTSVPTQTLDVYGAIARSGLKLPRVDYGTFTAGATVSVPILFSDTQYSHVEIRIHYVVSVMGNITMSALDTSSAAMSFEEASLTTYKYNSQTAYSLDTITGTPTSFNFANNVEYYGIDNLVVIRIVRATGTASIGYRNHYMYDNVFCISGVGTARGYGIGHINNSSQGGPAIASFRLTAASGTISGNYTTTHYN